MCCLRTSGTALRVRPPRIMVAVRAGHERIGEAAAKVHRLLLQALDDAERIEDGVATQLRLRGVGTAATHRHIPANGALVLDDGPDAGGLAEDAAAHVPGVGVSKRLDARLAAFFI